MTSKQPDTRAGKVNHYLAAGSDLCVDKYQIGQETVKLWGREGGVEIHDSGGDRSYPTVAINQQPCLIS